MSFGKTPGNEPESITFSQQQRGGVAKETKKVKIKKVIEFFEFKDQEKAKNIISILEKAKTIAGVTVDHRVYFSSQEFEKFLDGSFETEKLNTVLENLEETLKVYGAFTPPLNITLFWGKMFLEPGEQLKGRLMLTSRTSQMAMHGMVMDACMDRTAEYETKEFSEKKERRRLLVDHLLPIKQAAEITKSEMGISTYRSVDQEVLNEMRKIESPDFSGASQILDGGKGKALIAGMPTYIAGAVLDDPKGYSHWLWKEFIQDKDAFWDRCVDELGQATAKEIDYRNTVAYQFKLCVRRISQVTGNRDFLGEFNEKFEALGSLLKEVGRSKSVVDNNPLPQVSESPSSFIFGEKKVSSRDSSRMHRDFFSIDDYSWTGDQTDDERLIQEEVNKISKSKGLNTEESQKLKERIRKEVAVKIGRIKSQRAEWLNRKPVIGLRTWKGALDYKTKEGNRLLSFRESIRSEREETAKTVSQKPQTRNELMPAEYWEKYQNKFDIMGEKVKQLEQRVQALNKEHQVQIGIDYMSDMKAQIENKNPKLGVNLHVLGNLESVIGTLETVDTALDKYPPNLFAGQKINIIWYDSYNFRVAGSVNQESMELKAGVKEGVIHHELAHVLDYLEGESMEQEWYEQEFDHAIARKRAIDAKMIEDVLREDDSFPINFKTLPESRLNNERAMWLMQGNRVIEYEFDGEKNQINAADHIKGDGSFKDTPTLYGLTNGAEERAEVWRVFMEDPEGIRNKDEGIQRRYEAMKGALIRSEKVDPEWFVEKEGGVLLA